MACRNLKKCEESRGLYGVWKENTKCGLLDLSDMKSVRTFAVSLITEYGDNGIDYLVNNAGGVFAGDQKTAQGLEMNMGVMHFGHYLLTKLLTPLLKNSKREAEHGPARVVNHASVSGIICGRTGCLHHSVFEGDGEGSLRGELSELNCCSNVLTGFAIDFHRVFFEVLSCSYRYMLQESFGGQNYGYAKMWQIGITPMQQEEFDNLGGRQVVTSSVHPGLVYSQMSKRKFHADIYFFVDMVISVIMRPLEMASNVVIHGLLSDDFPPGSFLDDHYGAHDITAPQEVAQNNEYSPAASIYYWSFPNRDPNEGHKRMKFISDRIIQPYLELDT